ncbi:hypothetical protein A2382_00010 [Candidatus Woesebacteria bacterium RIFOXYB1_FULL_38_16]|uniref:Uncharacterized protein n=1 Tax=Candidatus Woesebacteria bacterium RIFOXYB1_FULL_38_16 TaxID=1802538 RepID=A0A1F8CT93_9BACT|nr:MAG: hypothetical protein A2191_01575 [Candidatus Woesebacteria bacterium RIFOXYA1_FULL_38_9]OGM79530.1 MAG: hypothetical protein A2382_00010 [Candidatus Woesebacteria bacterium RIFOXYB1_FULL_38_16]
MTLWIFRYYTDEWFKKFLVKLMNKKTIPLQLRVLLTWFYPIYDYTQMPWWDGMRWAHMFVLFAKKEVPYVCLLSLDKRWFAVVQKEAKNQKMFTRGGSVTDYSAAFWYAKMLHVQLDNSQPMIYLDIEDAANQILRFFLLLNQVEWHQPAFLTMLTESLRWKASLKTVFPKAVYPRLHVEVDKFTKKMLLLD